MSIELCHQLQVQCCYFEKIVALKIEQSVTSIDFRRVFAIM